MQQGRASATGPRCDTDLVLNWSRYGRAVAYVAVVRIGTGVYKYHYLAVLTFSFRLVAAKHTASQH